MSKPILYYTLMSPPARAALLAVKELGLDLELVNIDLLKREQFSPNFLKLNPQHTIPTLDDNGTIIWDSHAIQAYLVDKYAKSDALYPKDLATRAHVNQRLIFDAANIFERLRTILRPVFYSGATEIPQERIDFVIDGYEILESVFNGNKYLVGNQLTIGDFSTIASISSVRPIVPIDEVKFPKIIQWIALMETLPYYAEINEKGVDELMKRFFGKLDENKQLKGK